MSWFSLCAMVFALGLRHGLDADHLATIDGLTRFNLSARSGLSRWCGALFAGGHGCVVILFAAVVGDLPLRDVVPGWASAFGAWVSIGTLLMLGLLNLHAALSAPRDAMLRPVGLRGRLLLPLTRTTRPLGVAALGALFAISFDTLSQAVLFSTTAARFGGWYHGAVLGVLFTLGMLCIDGLNGLCVAALLGRADRRARLASRAIGLLVALLSLAVGGIGLARYFHLQLEVFTGAGKLLTGLALLTAAALGLLLMRSLLRLAFHLPTSGRATAERLGPA
jgi:high-affinity nickel-transport protein